MNDGIQNQDYFIKYDTIGWLNMEEAYPMDYGGTRTSELLQVMAWHWTGHKILSEPMLTHNRDLSLFMNSILKNPVHSYLIWLGTKQVTSHYLDQYELKYAVYKCLTSSSILTWLSSSLSSSIVNSDFSP